MKNTISKMLFVALIAAANLSYGQTNPEVKPKRKIKVTIGTAQTNCESGFSICFSFENIHRIANIGIYEVNGKEYLCVQKQGMNDEVMDEFTSAPYIPFTYDLVFSEEQTRALGYSGTFTILRGNYPIEQQDEYFVIPIKTRHE
jgi:predicted esterase YcpF (UPF0227 family)